MERYWDCSLCRIEPKGKALRCRTCSGKLRGRERLLHEIALERRLRPKGAWLSLVAAGAGQMYQRRWATGVLFAILLPLAIGLVLAVWNGFSYGHLFLVGTAGFVLAVAWADARWGPTTPHPPCQDACPARVPIPDYLQLILDGDPDQGHALARTRLPLVGVIGRICPHPCETHCVRGIDGEPIAINGCKRFMADQVRARRPEAGPSKVVHLDGGALRVAVVGSGPAGLSCAYFLSVLGASVTVYEADEVLGGRLATTIPDYRLPPYILDEELAELRGRGIAFRTGAPVGPGGKAVADLLRDHDGVFLAVGAARSVALTIPGAELCIDFQEVLRASKGRAAPRLGRRVVVVGGGNAAMDVCRTALRLGAEEVHLLYRRTRDEMPARPEEVEEALREGVRFHFLADPVEVRPGSEGLEVEVRTMELGPPDESGRPRPMPVEGRNWVLAADTVVPALGQTVESPVFSDPALQGLRRERDGRIRVDPRTQRTSLERVYAGGDAVAGPSTAVEAMAQGRRAALGMYADLAREALPVMRLRDRRLRHPFPGHRETPEARIREEMPKLAGRLRKEGFREVELGFNPAAARREAGRCLQCHREL
ncbi:MAG: FAD-dependent oxidoreductase [Deltaproteobacteria bacterium]|nr:FAD-dependent oxidoreductase [Deltaproteobacteria bacterium]